MEPSLPHAVDRPLTRTCWAVRLGLLVCPPSFRETLPPGEPTSWAALGPLFRLWAGHPSAPNAEASSP